MMNLDLTIARGRVLEACHALAHHPDYKTLPQEERDALDLVNLHSAAAVLKVGLAGRGSTKDNQEVTNAN